MAPHKCTHAPRCSAKAKEQFDAAIEKAWKDLRANSTNADEDLRKTIDQAISELKYDLNRAKDFQEQDQLGRGKVYLAKLADGIDEASAERAYNKAKNMSRDAFDVAVTKATERPGRLLKENVMFRREEWSDAENIYHHALAQAEEDYQNAATRAAKGCKQGNTEVPRARESTDATKLKGPLKTIGWTANE